MTDPRFPLSSCAGFWTESSPPGPPVRVLSAFMVRGAAGGLEKNRGTATRTKAVRIIARKSRFSIYAITSSRDGIEAAGSKRVAACNATQRHPASADGPVALECLNGVRRAAWIVATCGRQERGERYLIAAYEQDEDRPHHAGQARMTACCTPAVSSVRSTSNAAAYARGPARTTRSAPRSGRSGRISHRTSSRRRRFRRLRSTMECRCFGTMMPTRG